MKPFTTILLLLLTAAIAIADDALFMRTLSNADIVLSNGKDTCSVNAGDVYPFVGYDDTGALVKLKAGPYTFYLRKSNVRLVSESEVAAAKAAYEKDMAQFLPGVTAWEQEQSAKQGSSQSVSSSQGSPASPSVPPVITVEPTYYWNVEVVVGRKYAWTEDTYERYKTFTTEVQAKSKSEAESIAAGQSYTTNSNLIQAKITVEPAGTKNAKFRVKDCTATRQ